MAIAIDPVWWHGGRDRMRALLTFEYQGTTYYFCSKACLPTQGDPGTFPPQDDAPPVLIRAPPLGEIRAR
jgi:YHS domain-containing protein